MWGNLQVLHFQILPIFNDFLPLTLSLIRSKRWFCPPLKGTSLCTLLLPLHYDEQAVSFLKTQALSFMKVRSMADCIYILHGALNLLELRYVYECDRKKNAL